MWTSKMVTSSKITVGIKVHKTSTEKTMKSAVEAVDDDSSDKETILIIKG